MAGGDITVFRSAGEQAPEVIGRLIGLFHRTIRRIRGLDAIVVAGVHGAVAGGGVGLALACDFVVATEDASFVPAYTQAWDQSRRRNDMDGDAPPRSRSERSNG